ncbi:afadin- and alpha-actinin-binding protein-like isoform X2 [Stegodyphus dumicola]|uniref:afadin- and alpha-actinin-binding protein-like isoform X2 n=1 Tax=Stegodyphus dumicola TaxID=202533 RepID=UPI0015B228BF|nr:afadin- and alpha-actinin-binding protein-like isoform X2 [Stegodyphus dumicola]
MNQPRSVYKNDFCAYDWLENNITPDPDEFCTPDNVDDCLKYVSREFSALGYPSIYSNTSSCPFSVNCDIVNFLNGTFELLRSCTEHVQTKEVLENRNHCLSADIKALCKKNSQLKNSLDQSARKYGSALEKERQLKERNDQLLQQLKYEKNEVRKVVAQMQQQKIAYEHEIRKQENYVNQMKSRMNQLLANRNAEKKTASIISPNLPKSDKQRGKWKTESAAKSCLEEMYNSVISSYENRVKEMLKEIKEYHHCLEYIRSEMRGIISSVKIDKNEIHECADINHNGQPFSEENFKILLSRIKEIISQNVNPCMKESCEVNALDSALFNKESEKIERSKEEINDKNFESASENKVLKMEPANQMTRVHFSTDTEKKVFLHTYSSVMQNSHIFQHTSWMESVVVCLLLNLGLQISLSLCKLLFQLPHFYLQKII